MFKLLGNLIEGVTDVVTTVIVDTAEIVEDVIDKVTGEK